LDAEDALSVEESVDSALAGVLAFEPDLTDYPSVPADSRPAGRERR
jgi:hypothetical protein